MSDIRIEYPSKGATYFNNAYGVYQYDFWPRHSVLSGQSRRTYLGEFKTLEEALKEYPKASVSEGCGYRDIDPGPIPPTWFDPADAGERWDDDY